MPMLTSRNINGGHMAGLTKSSYINRCSFLPLLPAGVSMAHAICWGRREPSAERDLRVEPTAMELVSPDSTWEEITELYWDSCRGCQGGVAVKRGLRSTFTRKSWTPSKNASGISGLLLCQRQSRNGDWPTLIDPIPMLNLLPCPTLHMSSLPPCSGIHARKHWSSQCMPTSVPWQLWLY